MKRMWQRAVLEVRWSREMPPNQGPVDVSGPMEDVANGLKQTVLLTTTTRRHFMGTVQSASLTTHPARMG